RRVSIRSRRASRRSCRPVLTKQLRSDSAAASAPLSRPVEYESWFFGVHEQFESLTVVRRERITRKWLPGFRTENPGQTCRFIREMRNYTAIGRNSHTYGR